VNDTWADGGHYEQFMGRWSRVLARDAVTWLAIAPGSAWLDVGCGTGALSAAILDLAAPRELRAIDASPEYVAAATARLAGKPFAAQVADAAELPFETDSFDVVVSGLVLNFVPRYQRAVAEMSRVARPGATVAFYLWDYVDDGMHFLRRFWDVAVRLDPAARELDEGVRFAFNAPEPMRALAHTAGLRDIETAALVVPTAFRDFDDLWQPFLGGQGPAPTYLKSLAPARRDELRDALRTNVPTAHDGSITLSARAWIMRARA
jgi:SAM-dependent methyltransferase